ncbi:hypothetical protein QEH56_21160 [Pelagicoccus enzymogenes]|uniref:hypothetical protein n=1 Tax=Pelagicoccus enzymogenes TaxID=2773457 RepID=UPI00280EC0B3|nr:hypothetical protein [Pelagicoccus enzymogenes]MDQ8200690.1 hypothetical protein [Pelagicoccus enzymogenes]
MAELEAVLAKKEKLARIDELLGESSNPKTQPSNFWEAPDFAGQSYFDSQYKDMAAEEQSLLKNSSDPEFKTKYQDLKQREKELHQVRKKWGQSYPEELKGLKELSTEQAIAGDTPTGKYTSGKQYAGLQAINLLAPEDKDKVSILENAGWKVDMVNGFPKVSNPETGQEFVLNKPGFSQRDLTDFIATALQYAGVGPATRAVTGIGKKVAVGAAASALTEATKQGIEKALGGEYDLGEVGLSALFGGASEVAIPALRGIWNKLSPAGREKLLQAKSLEEIRRLGVASQDELANIQKLVQKAQEAQSKVAEVTGEKVPIFRGQATQLPSQQLEQRYLAQLDPTSAKALNAMRGQNEKAFTATIKLLDTIGPVDSLNKATMGIRQAARSAMASEVDSPLMKSLGESMDVFGKAGNVEGAAKRAREVAKSIQGQAEAARESATSQLYNEAYRESPSVQLGPVRSQINAFLNRFKEGGRARNVVQRAQKLLSDEVKERPASSILGRNGRPLVEAGTDSTPPTLQQIHDARIEIDSLLKWDGADNLPVTAKNALLEIRNSLNAQVGKVSPKFRQADAKFAEMSRPIEELDKSLVGAIARKGDATIEAIGDEVFSGKWGSDDVARLRYVMESNSKGSYGDLYRGYVDQKLSKLAVSGATPQKYLQTLFPDAGSVKRMLDYAPDEASKKAIQRMRVDLEKAMTKYAGSKIGAIAKIPDDKVDSVLNEVFSPNVLPDEVETIKKVVVANGGADAWNQLVRRELFKRVSGVELKAREKGTESIQNIANELVAAIYGNPLKRKALMQAVDGEAKKNLLYLEQLLDFAGSGRAAGSPTAPFQRIYERLMGRFKVVKSALTSPLDTSAKIGDETIFNRNARALSDIVFDEQWLDRMSKIRNMGASPKALDSLVDLLEDAVRTGTQGARGTAVERFQGAGEED